jgi:hypothetical protein
MSAPNSKDYFSSFLEAAGLGEKRSPSDASSEDGGVEKALLAFLASAKSPVSAKDLVSQLSYPPSVTVSALQNLAAAQLVDIKQVDGDEVAELTPLGRSIGPLPA